MEDDLNALFQTNVVGNIRLFNALVPLIKNGELKKVVTLGSGMTDEEQVLKMELAEAPTYSVSKAAMNMVNAKSTTPSSRRTASSSWVSVRAVSTRDTWRLVYVSVHS
jgi:short-subunit dehydrogenase involved in D-alanine esterification of teichoic acids